MSVCLFVCVSVCLSVCLFVCSFVCSSVRPSVRLSVGLSFISLLRRWSTFVSISSPLTSSFIPWILMFALLQYCSWSSIFVSSLFIVVSSVAILASFVARCSVNCSSFVVSIYNLFAISCGYSNCLSSFSTYSSFNSSIIRRASPASLASLATGISLSVLCVRRFGMALPCR